MTNTESIFRDAFERLKAGRPVRVPADSRVSQGMVAREAGRDPSSFKKARYPQLIQDIQEWILASAQTSSEFRTSAPEPKQKRASSEEAMERLRNERDHALSLLVQADALILDLTQQLESFRSATAPESNRVTDLSTWRTSKT